MTAFALAFEYELAFRAVWHVGSGLERGAIDRATLLDGRGLPFVPGSALKGFVREQAEILAAAVGVELASTHHRRGERPVDVGDLARSPRPVERLFGSAHAGDRLFFSDAVCADDLGPLPATRLRLAQSRVAMDRLLRRAKERHLFTTEVLAPTTLRGRILAEHSEGELTRLEPGTVRGNDFTWPLEWALLVGGLLALERVGGDRSVGRGACELEVRSLQLRARQEKRSADKPELVQRLVEEIVEPLVDEAGLGVMALRHVDAVRPRGPHKVAEHMTCAVNIGGVASEGEWREALELGNAE